MIRYPLIGLLIGGMLGLALSADGGQGKIATVEDTASPNPLGSFEDRGGRAGIVVCEGRLFVEALAIHRDVVEPGVFLLDTGGTTGCVMDRHFAEKMKILGIGNISLTLGDQRLKNVKATVLDHPELQRIFRRHTALFKNRPVAGIIGWPALERRRTTLDFERFTLTIDPEPEKETPAAPTEEKPGQENPAPAQDKETAEANKSTGRGILGSTAKTADGAEKNGASKEGRYVVPFRPAGDDPTVPRCVWLDVNLNGKFDGVFRLSTGSSSTWILKESAGKAGLRRDRPPRSLVVGGVSLPPVTFTFKALEASPEKRSVPFTVTGCLACDVLMPFRVILDGPGRRLELEFLNMKKSGKR